MPTNNSTTFYTTDGTSYSSGPADSTGWSWVNYSNPTAARLSASGLFSGAQNSVRAATNVGFTYNPGTVVEAESDWRVRVSCSNYTFYGFADATSGDPVPGLFAGPLMAPLAPSLGVVFPFTPQVTVTHNARYGSAQLTHSNYAAYFYEGSEVAAINISGEFTVQNQAEGQYLIAALYFFRSASKMFFGSDRLAGNPPPLLFLDGYGSHYLPHVPCVLTSMTHVMPNDVDYVEFPVNTSLMQTVNQVLGTQFNNTTRLPTTSTIQLTLQPVYSRSNVYNNFSLQGFAQGNLLGGAQSPSGIPGGFL